eukprot:scaffold47976_cov72-Phaeocystis_antarctica.AAC.2
MPHADGGLQQQPVRKLSRPLLRVIRHLGCQAQAHRLVRVRAPHARERSVVVGAERGLRLTGAACAATEQCGASADDPVVRRQAHEQRDTPDGASQRTHHRDASLRECRHRCLQLRLLFSRHPLIILSAARLLGAHAQQHDAQRRRSGCHAPSLVVSHSGGGASSGGGNGDGGSTSAPQHRSSHSNPTAAQRSVIRVSSASICSQLPTKSTSPNRSAVGASNESPVQKARSHAAAESRWRAATLTTPGSTPRRTSGKPKVASACASTSLGVESGNIEDLSCASLRWESKSLSPSAEHGLGPAIQAQIKWWHCQAGLSQRAARACRGTGRASRRRASRRDTRPRWEAPRVRAGRVARRRRAGRRGRHSAGWRRRRGCHPRKSARGRCRGRPARRRLARWAAARRHR